MVTRGGWSLFGPSTPKKMRLTQSERARVADTVIRRIRNPEETRNYDKELARLKRKADKSTRKDKYARRIRRLERTMRRKQLDDSGAYLRTITTKMRRLDGALASSGSPKDEAAALARLAALQEQLAAMSAKRAAKGVTRLADFKAIAVKAVQDAVAAAAALAPETSAALAATPEAAKAVQAGAVAAAVQAMQQGIQQQALALHAVAPLAPPPVGSLPPPLAIQGLAMAGQDAAMAAAQNVHPPELQALIDAAHQRFAAETAEKAARAEVDARIAADKAAVAAGLGAARALPGQFVNKAATVGINWLGYLNPANYGRVR